MDLLLRQRVAEFYTRYSEVISDDLLEQWPEFFTEDCAYKLTSRVNFDRKFPLCTILCESRGGLTDRLVAIRNTLVYAPRHINHTVSNGRVIEVQGSTLVARSMFCVWQTLTDGETRLQMVGRSFDRIDTSENELRFQERVAVFDSELVPGSIVYPI